MTSTMAARPALAPNRSWASPRAGHYVVVALLIGLSLTLRLGGLAPATLWRDDTWVALVHRAPLVRSMYMGLSAPGFNLFLREWFAVVGFSEFRAQIPALAFGTLAPAALYLLALRMGLRWSTALLAAALLATSTPYVEVSVRVKQYSFDALAAVIVLWLAWRVVQLPDDARRWAWLAGGAAVLVAVSAAVVTVVLGSFVAALVAAWRAGSLLRRPVVTALAAFGAFAAAWWLTFLRRARSSSLQHFWSPAMIQARPARGATHGQSLGGSAYQRISDLLQHFLTFAVHQRSLVLLVFIASAVILGARRPLLLLLLAAPFLTAVVLSIAQVAPLGGSVLPVNGSRIDVYLYPSLALLLAAGIDQMLGMIDHMVEVRAGALPGWFAPTIMLVVVAAVLSATATSSYPRSDTKAFIRYLDTSHHAGDTLVIGRDAKFQYSLYTRWPISVVSSKQYETGFTTLVSPPGLDIVEKSQRARPTTQSAPTTPRVFLLGSRFGAWPSTLEDWLRRGGYRQAWDREAPGATLQLWVK